MNQKKGHTNRGKWSQRGVPHKGWTCVSVYDADDNMVECEMCESTHIRFVHVMSHADYPERLRVGRVCAEHMEGDRVNPRRREKKLMNRAKRRAGWLDRKWRTSAAGVVYLNTDGFHISLYPSRHRGFTGHIENQMTGFKTKATKVYQTLDDAKLAALQGLFNLLDKQP